MSQREHHWLGSAAVLLVVAAATAIAAITAGVFDPKPIGQESRHQPLTAKSVEAGQRRRLWLELPLPEKAYSLRLTAAYESGEMDVGYGMLIGSDTAYLALEVSPLGYVTIRQGSDGGRPPVDLLPWQPWPHVRTGRGVNELWLDVSDGRVTARLNREWLWSGEVEELEGRAGLVWESFGQTASIDFQALQLFTADPP